MGIPTVKDRVVQAAVKLILKPIFEADFEDCSHGFRPGRSTHDALRAGHQNLKEGRRVGGTKRRGWPQETKGIRDAPPECTGDP